VKLSSTSSLLEVHLVLFYCLFCHCCHCFVAAQCIYLIWIVLSVQTHCLYCWIHSFLVIHYRNHVITRSHLNNLCHSPTTTHLYMSQLSYSMAHVTLYKQYRCPHKQFDIHSHSSLVLSNLTYSHTDLCAASHHPHYTLAIKITEDLMHAYHYRDNITTPCQSATMLVCCQVCQNWIKQVGFFHWFYQLAGWWMYDGTLGFVVTGCCKQKLVICIVFYVWVLVFIFIEEGTMEPLNVKTVFVSTLVWILVQGQGEICVAFKNGICSQQMGCPLFVHGWCQG